MPMVGTFSPARSENYFDELAEEMNKHGGARPNPSVIETLYARYDSELVTRLIQAASTLRSLRCRPPSRRRVAREDHGTPTPGRRHHRRVSLALGAGSMASGELQNHWDRDPGLAASAELEVSDDGAVTAYASSMRGDSGQ